MMSQVGGAMPATVWPAGEEVRKREQSTCFAHVLCTPELVIGTSQKFDIVFYHQFSYRGVNFVEKHSLLYFWHFFPWCNVSRASLTGFVHYCT